MALNFPSNPSVNDIFTSASGVDYIWDGVRWNVSAGPNSEIVARIDALEAENTAVKARLDAIEAHLGL